MAKTDKKTTKPVTMPERVRRIELDVNRHGANMAVEMAAMREQLDRIERLLTTPKEVTGSPVDIKVPEEQGLEPGDYTDASKEVADELTAMGWGWTDEDRTRHKNIRRNVLDSGERGRHMCNIGASVYAATFIARARVTAKRLGLVPVEAKPWKPEVGELVVCVDTPDNEEMTVGSVWEVKSTHRGLVQTSNPKCENGWYASRFRPATPEEVAEYHADQETAKPIVFYDTKVMCQGKEWRVIEGPSHNGEYVLHRLWNKVGDTVQVKRHEFKVIN